MRVPRRDAGGGRETTLSFGVALTGRKKMQFSHLCSSVILYLIRTKFARAVPAS